MCAFVTKFEELNAFIFGIKHFREGTPCRWELVAEFVRGQTMNNSAGDVPTVCLGKRGDGETYKGKSVDLKKKDDCRMMRRFLGKNYPFLVAKEFNVSQLNVSGKSANKAVILLPPVLTCCGKRIKMDGRPSFPCVYTMNGTYVGAQFHGQCSSCKTCFYPSYKTVGSKRVYYNPCHETMRYFQVTSQTVFEKQLLEDISNNIWVNGATLQSRAKVYNVNFAEQNRKRFVDVKEFARTKDGEWLLNEDRVNDAWFMWIVVNYYHEKGELERTQLEVNYDERSKHLNTEELCEMVWKDICSSPKKWVRHKCTTTGCAEGYVTVDGNEYLKRGKCALPKEKVKLRRDLPEVYKCCPNSPVCGGKSESASKFCRIHVNHEREDVCDAVDMPLEFHSAVEQGACVVEENDESDGGCKKKENISLFFETTAGMLALIRPCGIVVNMTEMFTCESVTQVFLFLLRTFCDNAEDFERLKFLGYDRACGLVPFLNNQRRNGSAGAKILLDNVKFLVDIFHVSKHTEEVCMPPDNPKCKYHPFLAEFDAIKGANTESCEQGFRRLNEYFKLTRKMLQFKRNVLFWFVNERFNSDLESELRRKGLM